MEVWPYSPSLDVIGNKFETTATIASVRKACRIRFSFQIRDLDNVMKITRGHLDSAPLVAQPLGWLWPHSAVRVLALQAPGSRSGIFPTTS